MTIPVIGHIPNGWEYNADNSEENYREYDCISSEFGTMTYASVTEKDDEFFVTGCIMGRDKVEESFDNAKDANRRAIDFMEENP